MGNGLRGGGSEGVVVGNGGRWGVDGRRVDVRTGVGEFAGEELLLGEVRAYD